VLRQNEAVGQRHLSELREMCNEVCINTANKGKETLKKEIEDLEAALQCHLSTIGNILLKINCNFFLFIYCM
jgi:hypothetical protein